MKKQAGRLISILLCAVMLFSSMTFGASALSAESQNQSFVFVHGLFGWGGDDGASEYIQYWGMTTGNLLKKLENKGYECANASVGTVSSAWDRACELYAQLTGGTVDYGAAHSAKHNHARYGRTYAEPIIQQWDEDHKVNLIGHSFGGATVRLFVQLLGEGSEEERSATPANELSPLFEGGKAKLVNSVTAIAAPHNGTSFFEASGGYSEALVKLFSCLATFSGMTPLNKYFDPMLDQFGLSNDPNSDTAADFLIKNLRFFINSKDNAFYDLTIDGAAELNESIRPQQGVYYYSYAGSKTHRSLSTGDEVPSLGMHILFYPFSKPMGSFTGVTEGGIVIDEKWQENDGIVNTISAKAPFGEPSKAYCRWGKTKPGIWYVMPVERMDHMAFIGGMLNVTSFRVDRFYDGVMKVILSSGK